MGIGASIFLVAVGAIIAFALEARVGWLDLDVVGWVLMLAGLFGLLLTFGVFNRRRRVVGTTTERSVYEAPPAAAPPVAPPAASPPRPTMVERPQQRQVVEYEEIERPL
jgi:hypothetical protein